MTTRKYTRSLSTEYATDMTKNVVVVTRSDIQEKKNTLQKMPNATTVDIMVQYAVNTAITLMLHSFTLSGRTHESLTLQSMTAEYLSN